MTPEILFAASAGMLAAFNPCGFALLPGYLALFLGPERSTRGTVRRALVVGGAVTLGFVAVFGALGAAVSLLSFGLGPWLSVVTVLAGVVLLVVGVLLLGGRDVSVRLPPAQLAVGRSAPGMVAYGVVYATVSLSCTLPVFVAAVVSVFATSGTTLLPGVLAALAYRPWTRHVGRASGLVVTLAALYVLWYGWVELQTYSGREVAPGPVAWVATASAGVSQAITDVGTVPLLAALTAVVVAVGGLERRSRRRRVP